jgi:hypothetical protein
MLSHTVRHARKRRGLSCATVDTAAGLLPDTTELIERGALIPPPDVLRHLAYALASADAAPGLYVALLLDAGVVSVEELRSCARRVAA